MIREMLQRVFSPHPPPPPPPRVQLTPEWEKRRRKERDDEIMARMERLRLEAERPIRHIYDGPERRRGTRE